MQVHPIRLCCSGVGNRLIPHLTCFIFLCQIVSCWRQQAAKRWHKNWEGAVWSMDHWIIGSAFQIDQRKDVGEACWSFSIICHCEFLLLSFSSLKFFKMPPTILTRCIYSVEGKIILPFAPASTIALWQQGSRATCDFFFWRHSWRRYPDTQAASLPDPAMYLKVLLWKCGTNKFPEALVIKEGMPPKVMDSSLPCLLLR